MAWESTGQSLRGPQGPAAAGGVGHPAAAAGLKSWNYEPLMISAGVGITSRAVMLHRMEVPATTVTGLCLYVTMPGSLSAMRIALFDPVTGTRMANGVITSGVDWGLDGMKRLPFAAPVAVPAGMLWAAFSPLYTSGAPTYGTFSNGHTNFAYNVGATGSARRWVMAAALHDPMPSTLPALEPLSPGAPVWLGLY